MRNRHVELKCGCNNVIQSATNEREISSLSRYVERSALATAEKGSFVSSLRGEHMARLQRYVNLVIAEKSHAKHVLMCCNGSAGS